MDIGDEDEKAEQLRQESAENLKFAHQFLMAAPLQQVSLLRVCLAPEINLMRKLVHLSSANWEVTQLHNQGAPQDQASDAVPSDDLKRTFRLSTLAKGELYAEFVAETMSQSQCESLWSLDNVRKDSEADH